MKWDDIRDFVFFLEENPSKQTNPHPVVVLKVLIDYIVLLGEQLLEVRQLVNPIATWKHSDPREKEQAIHIVEKIESTLEKVRGN